MMRRAKTLVDAIETWRNGERGKEAKKIGNRTAQRPIVFTLVSLRRQCQPREGERTQIKVDTNRGIAGSGGKLAAYHHEAPEEPEAGGKPPPP